MELQQQRQNDKIITYSQLFKAAIDDIKMNIVDYSGITLNGEEEAKLALDKYFLEKKYQFEDNIIDSVIIALAKISECQISVLYQRADGAFCTHNFEAEIATSNGRLILSRLNWF